MVEAGVVIGCDEQRGLEPEAVSEQGKGNNCWHRHKRQLGSIIKPIDIKLEAR